ncbi:MAG TPA: RDD family protein [Chloroflexota bacterium]
MLEWTRLLALIFDLLLMATPLVVAVRFVGVPGAAAINGLYVVGMMSSRKQATLGMMFFGLVITDQVGDPITLRRAVVRYLASLVSVLTFGFGYFIGLFTRRRQTFHDLLAATLIVRRAEVTVGEESSLEAP